MLVGAYSDFTDHGQNGRRSSARWQRTMGR